MKNDWREQAVNYSSKSFDIGSVRFSRRMGGVELRGRSYELFVGGGMMAEVEAFFLAEQPREQMFNGSVRVPSTWLQHLKKSLGFSFREKTLIVPIRVRRQVTYPHSSVQFLRQLGEGRETLEMLSHRGLLDSPQGGHNDHSSDSIEDDSSGRRAQAGTQEEGVEEGH